MVELALDVEVAFGADVAVEACSAFWAEVAVRRVDADAHGLFSLGLGEEEVCWGGSCYFYEFFDFAEG
jgi:hypothetical protein